MGIDLTVPAIQRDPYPTYAEMRRQPSIALVQNVFSSKDTHFITRYQDAMLVLKDPRFVNNGRNLPNWEDWTKKWYIPAALKVILDTMALMDEPDHTRLRQLVHKAFTPTMIQELAGRIERLSNELLDAAARKPVVDFMSEFALPLPLNIIADIMGVSSADRKKFRRWMGDMITNMSPKDPLGAIPKVFNTIGMNRFFKRLIAERRLHPQDDLTTALVQAEEAGDRLSESELISMLFLMIFAGHETTVNLLGTGTLALLQHPDQFEKLKSNPELMDSAIEELLRYTSPVQHIVQRYAVEDVDIGGVHVPQSSPILVCVAAANRDETVFENAEALDITRNPNRHIAFGFGVHYCLGAPLARLEAKIAFTTLIQRFPDLRLAVPADQLKWRGAPILHGLVGLPVRLNG